MEWLKFIFLQASAILFAALQFFVLGAAFGAGAWVVWRASIGAPAASRTELGSWTASLDDD